jgi:membrane fusion protein (multidrug efflux system)
MTQAEVAVQVGKISVATLRRYVTAFGTVEPEPGTPGQAPASAKLTSPMTGLVAEVNCVEGQQVEKGHILFALDSRKLDAQTDRARAVLAAAEKSFSEQEKISKQDSAAQLLFARTRQERDLARSDLDFALAQQALLKVAAPCSGTVLRVNVRPGEVVDPQSPAALVEVADLKRLIVSANVPASDLPAVKTNQVVEILSSQNADGPPNVTNGRVAFVEDRVDPKTDMGTVDISVPAWAHWRPGQFVRVRIVAEEHRDCLAVPSQSLLKNEGGEWMICVVRGKLARQQPVVPGLREAGLVEVRSPVIKAGDSVVTTGAAALPQKSSIRILKD